jgi:hypothetical protein
MNRAIIRAQKALQWPTNYAYSPSIHTWAIYASPLLMQAMFRSRPRKTRFDSGWARSNPGQLPSLARG